MPKLEILPFQPETVVGKTDYILNTESKSSSSLHNKLSYPFEDKNRSLLMYVMDYVDIKATTLFPCRHVWLIELHHVVPFAHLP